MKSIGSTTTCTAVIFNMNHLSNAESGKSCAYSKTINLLACKNYIFNIFPIPLGNFVYIALLEISGYI